MPATARSVVDGRIAAPALDQLAQPRAELLAALLVVAMEIVRHLDFHDDAVQVDRRARSWRRARPRPPLAERLDQLGEGLARSPARPAPRPASARRRSAAAAAARWPPRPRAAARAIGRVSGSSSSKPASVSASSAASSTVRANTPTWSSVRDSSSAPLRGIRPCVGLKPTTPQKAAGRITEPLVCEPIAPGTMWAATAAAEPLDEPPGVRAGSCGLRGLAGVEIGVLGGDGLAHDHGAGGAQPRDGRRVARAACGRPRAASRTRSACRRCRRCP